ncbi:hypothetical protein [Spiroplasma endosymbiont of Nebria brevicollis]|uniref:hypothetical protein n=1 Tax=Spiroplasma endosymbiont of Nebria brevicollis TaxID=3066284 RepID=UPI00313E6A0F
MPQTQSNPQLKSVFLALITKYITTGETVNGFEMIPADKLVLGLPANIDAAANGIVTAEQLAQALIYLKELNSAIKIKGLMTWSVNWDANTDFGFMKMYQKLFSN